MRRIFPFALSFVTVVLAGCGSAGTTFLSGGGAGTQGAAISGDVHGGQQPISNSKIYLYAAGASGYASAPRSLLAGAGYVTTNANGGFNITGDYSCPAAPGDLVYLLAVGGNPGGAAGKANPNLVIMAALGACGSLSSSTHVRMNEVTAAASAYALAPFMGYAESEPAAGTAVNLGAPAGGSSCNAAAGWLSTGQNTCDYIGLENAFATVNNLVDISTGTVQSGSATLVPPQAKLNALADIMAACVNSAGGSAGDGAGGSGVDSNCGTFFDDTTPASTGIAPTDTLQAILNLARNPGTSSAVSTSLLGLISPTAPFQTPISTIPDDWTLSITLSGGGLNGPTALGIDATGNVWVANYYGVLSSFGPTGTPLFASGISGYGLNESYGLAIDDSGNVWVTNNDTAGINSGLGSISEFTNGGSPLSGSLGFSAGGIDYPEALAADTDGSVWVANYGDSSVTHLARDGTAEVSGLTAASIAFPTAIAVDGNHNAWVGSSSNSQITKISSDGKQITPFACCDEAIGLAVDASNNIWTANWAGGSVSLVSNSGAVVSSGYTGGGLAYPSGIAADGSGTVWVANYHKGSFSKLAGAAGAVPGAALSPTTGFGADAKLVEPYAIAIDPSGNVWISNYGSVPATGQLGTVTEFVGLATPVKTPLVGPATIP